MYANPLIFGKILDKNTWNLGEIGWDGVDWIGLAQDRDKWRALDEPSGSIKCWETTEWLHSWWPLKYSAP
jgi:hypothetical protein